jgi:hypothetical protein
MFLRALKNAIISPHLRELCDRNIRTPHLASLTSHYFSWWLIVIEARWLSTDQKSANEVHEAKIHTISSPLIEGWHSEHRNDGVFFSFKQVMNKDFYGFP